ncbi:hypothetical protein [Bradyrhizobium japonicum]|uniref:hypothetical protein n=1 Tax=Bradyrhizobium japonicum TaxID=375 RepID=UPI001E3ABE07|nr:hypothetical protein [Bradyrhizobium japonicum]MCD9892072.1 hypothetical protein [Bradyrhizobium japonicum]WRJ83898.1 hypothetical protein R3F78_02945 [Bradyrhizobium japonicum]WRJ92867.1 hypothetical protein R3F77_00660 [Bradyrhizobium japonicum]WRK46718.1 hypothetical protein R3F73_00715 [Bradyrhizobium japonicum]
MTKATISGCQNPIQMGGPCQTVVYARNPFKVEFKIKGVEAATDKIVAATQLGPIQVKTHGNSKVAVKLGSATAEAIKSLLPEEHSKATSTDRPSVAWLSLQGEAIGSASPGESVLLQFRLNRSVDLPNSAIQIFEILCFEDGRSFESKHVDWTGKREEGSEKSQKALNVEVKLPRRPSGDFQRRYCIARATLGKIHLESARLELARLQNGFHFTPIIGVSWIPFSPLADFLLQLMRRIFEERFHDESMLLRREDIQSFSGFVNRIASFESEASDLLDSYSALNFFYKFNREDTIDRTSKQLFYNLLPLALSSNYAPGVPIDPELLAFKGVSPQVAEESLFRRKRPVGLVNLSPLFGRGLGDYRGYFHFTPWIEVRSGEIVDTGILGQKEFAVNDGGPSGLSGEISQFSLGCPVSSASITPIPFAVTGFFKNWDDVLGGCFVFLSDATVDLGRVVEKLRTRAKILSTGSEPILNKAVFWQTQKELRLAFSSQTYRRVFFERAEPSHEWQPVAQIALNARKSIRKAVFDFRHGGRVAPEGQKMATKMNGKTVPWICLGARVACQNDSFKMHFGHSLFPAHALFAAVNRSSKGESLICFAETRDAMVRETSSFREGVLVATNSPSVEDALRFIDVEHGAQRGNARPNGLASGLLFQSRYQRSQGQQNAPVDASLYDVFGDMCTGQVDLMSPYGKVWDLSGANVVWPARAVGHRTYLAVFLAREECKKPESDWTGYGAILCGRWSGGRKLPFCLANRSLFGVYHDRDETAKFVSNHMTERGPVLEPSDFCPRSVLCVPITASELVTLDRIRDEWRVAAAAQVNATAFLHTTLAALGISVSRKDSKLPTEVLQSARLT